MYDILWLRAEFKTEEEQTSGEPKPGKDQTLQKPFFQKRNAPGCGCDTFPDIPARQLQHLPCDQNQTHTVSHSAGHSSHNASLRRHSRQKQ